MNRAALAAGLAALLAIGATGFALSGKDSSRGDTAVAAQELHGERFGILSSLPIYRAPQASVADMLSQEAAEPHWMRAAIEADNTFEPLDHIDAQALSQIDILLLIQPRALTPAEYVALDDWVRAGGRVLLVADPMLAGEPQFPLGDPRNPQAVAVTGPIEARWGLELRTGKSGDEAEREIAIGGQQVPVVLGGTFVKRPPTGGNSADCGLRHEGLVAVCSIGKGHAVLIADATLFEDEPGAGASAGALWSLLGILGETPSGN